MDGGMTAEIFSMAALSPNPNPVMTIVTLRQLLEIKARGDCPHVSSQELIRLILGLLTNPNPMSRATRANLLSVKGRLHALAGELDAAVVSDESIQCVATLCE